MAWAIAALVALAAAPPEEFSATSLLKSSFSAMVTGGSAGAAAPPQPMKVFSAGLGRTGTASLKTALTMLGLRTYHMKDGVMDTPGHMAAWMDHGDAAMQAASPSASRAAKERAKATTAAVLDLMAADGFNATTDMPACFMYSQMMQRYPNARVILTVRSSADVWATSIVGTIGRNLDIFGRVPYRWFPFMRKMVDFNLWMWKTEFGMTDTGFDPDTRMPTHAGLVAAHHKWVARVKRDVPASKLLVFQPTDGWKPLCKFLSPTDAAVAAACKRILASGEPYPHVNDTATMKIAYAVFTAISYVALAAPLWVSAAWWSFSKGPKRPKPRTQSIVYDRRAKSQ